MVPKDKVTRLRMKLAEGGLPKGGGVGYEIFDKSDALGTTSFVQNINHLRALEGELARTIKASTASRPPASIWCCRNGRCSRAKPPSPRPRSWCGSAARLSRAGPRHPPSRRLRRQRPEAAARLDRRRNRPAARQRRRRCRQRGATGDERRAHIEKRMRGQIEAIVSSVVGSGRARVQLSADFDYNKITQTSDKFDPEGRVVRSSQTARRIQRRPPSNDGQVTVDNDLPGNQRPATARRRKDQSNKTEETINYEISRTTKTEVTEAGRVNRISVAVLVDGVYTKNEKGEMSTRSARKDELDRIATLVRSAIGFDQKRGDQVQVVNLKFAEGPAVNPINEPSGFLGMLQFTKDDVMYVIELGVMMLLSLVVLFMVIRPLVRRILASEVIPALIGADEVPALTDGSAAATGQNLVPAAAGLNQVDVAQVQGQVHAQTVHRVGELAERNPNETANIVRQWLSETAS